ncbi:hypothetical protein XA68_17336 [Ophiocordyceps unilateralis]|uniref:Extracellular membrane protein CFEM domain-containing protein n=1 Tax=Ophiocordyceps unilateralis TaxID=268505 RepID=A0A2A9P504_OPHUN|nr:hypothetical protein XA68_17336 [Ophiocordyceps unilateralis]
MKHLLPALALASAVVRVLGESSIAALRQTPKGSVEARDDARDCNRQNECLASLSKVFNNILPIMSRFCDQNQGAMTDEARDLSLLPAGHEAEYVRDRCTARGGRRSMLHASCACIAKDSTLGVKECRRALEHKLGGAQAVTDFCYLATFGESRTVSNPYSNRTVLTDLDACADRRLVVEVCQAAVPWNQRWSSPQCLQDECYIAMEMLVDGSIQQVCRGMLAGRVSSVTGFRLAARHCDVQRQIKACRCVTAPEPEFGDSEPACQETQCFKGLQKHLGRHSNKYCQAVLDAHDGRDDGLDGPAMPSLASDARRLGCRYRELIEACRCTRPSQVRQHPTCAHDECYGAMEEHYEGFKDAIESYCDELRVMTPADSERDLRRYHFGPQCFKTAAVRSACSCVSRNWQAPACVADECYRGIDSGLAHQNLTVFDFCKGVIRDPSQTPEAALPGIGSSCPNTAALRKACDCVVPPESRTVWLGNLGPAHCYRDSCFSSIERSYHGDFHIGVVGFCKPTLRQLTLDAAKVPIPEGCADAQALEEACFCAVPKESRVWTSPKCVDDACYRRIDHGAPINDFCRSWRRSLETTAVSSPTFPGLQLSCPGPESISKACDCHQPHGTAEWAEPRCAQNQCYASLDEALDQYPGVRRFCQELQWTQQNQLPAPKVPTGLGKACAGPEAVAEACNCVMAEDVELIQPSSSDDFEFLDPVCMEQACRSGMQRTLGHDAGDVCRALVDGIPLEQQGVSQENIALLQAGCDDMEPKTIGKDYAREKAGPIRRRDVISGVQSKMMAACRCILLRPSDDV